jgi:hypothetical protein
MKLRIMQFSPTSLHFIPLRTKYSPQHPVLYTSFLCLLPFCYNLYIVPSVCQFTSSAPLSGPQDSLQFTPFPLVPSFLCFSFLGWGKTVHLIRQPLTGLLYQPHVIDDECEAVGGMRIGRGNRSTRRTPAPVPRFSPQVGHGLSRGRVRAGMVGSRRITA